MKKNISVIGCGYWGKNLVRNIYELEALNSIHDPNLELSNHLSKEYSIESKTLEEIYNDKTVEGVVIATPAETHADLAISFLKKGKHVYVEKPLALNIKDAKRMIETASRENKILMVGHLLRYHPAFIKTVELVRSKKLGEIVHIYSSRMSFGKIRSEEDVVWSFAPHDISMVIELAGELPIKTSIHKTSKIRENIADIAHINLKFKKFSSIINVSWLHPFKEHKLEIVCEKGSIVFDDTMPWDKKLIIYKNNISVDKSNTYMKKQDFEYMNIEEAEPLKVECKHFIDCINENKRPITDGNKWSRGFKST